jgi:hypothetical protein
MLSIRRTKWDETRKTGGDGEQVTLSSLEQDDYELE